MDYIDVRKPAFCNVVLQNTYGGGLGFYRIHMAAWPDMAGKSQSVGSDVGANIDYGRALIGELEHKGNLVPSPLAVFQ